MTDAAAIIDRLRAATGPDAALDLAIAKAVGAKWHAWVVVATGRFAEYRRTPPRSALAYTASLDAALTLVPEGHWVEMQIVPEWKPSARCSPTGSSRRNELGATPAIALCIAALLARQAAEAASDDR